MSLGKSLFALGIAAGIAAAPAGASAATFFSFDGKTGTFGNTKPGPNTKFVDLFTFSVPAAGRLTITVTSLFTTHYTNLNLSNATRLDDIKLGAVSTGVLELRQLVNIPIAAGTHTIKVGGAAQPFSSYTGTLGFAIPEPATWALMILGMGGVAHRMRRRRARLRLRFS